MGCSAGGIYACQNGGTCNAGTCVCVLGYTGTTCQQCKANFLN